MGEPGATSYLTPSVSLHPCPLLPTCLLGKQSQNNSQQSYAPPPSPTGTCPQNSIPGWLLSCRNWERKGVLGFASDLSEEYGCLCKVRRRAARLLGLLEQPLLFLCALSLQRGSLFPEKLIGKMSSCHLSHAISIDVMGFKPYEPQWTLMGFSHAVPMVYYLSWASSPWALLSWLQWHCTNDKLVPLTLIGFSYRIPTESNRNLVTQLPVLMGFQPHNMHCKQFPLTLVGFYHTVPFMHSSHWQNPMKLWERLKVWF